MEELLEALGRLVDATETMVGHVSAMQKDSLKYHGIQPPKMRRAISEAKADTKRARELLQQLAGAAAEEPTPAGKE